MDIVKHIIIICLVSGIVNQTMLFGRGYLSPVGITESGADADIENMLADKSDNNGNSSFSYPFLMEPALTEKEINTIVNRIKNEPTTFRYVVTKIKNALKIDFSSRLVQYSLVAALTTLVIDCISKIIVKNTLPPITLIELLDKMDHEYFYVVYARALKHSLINGSENIHEYLQETVRIGIGLLKSWVIISIISRIKTARGHIGTALFGGLFFGGILGNSLDMLFYKYGIDWIGVFYGGVANLADYAYWFGFYGLIRSHVTLCTKYLLKFVFEIVLRMKGALLYNTQSIKYSLSYLFVFFTLYSIGKSAIIVVPVYEIIRFFILNKRHHQKISPSQGSALIVPHRLTQKKSSGESLLMTAH